MHSSIYGSTKGKTGRKVPKTHFSQHCVHRVPGTSFTNLVAPQKSGVPRPIKHSETVIACMTKQILPLFQLKKLKRAIFTKKSSEGRKKRAFPKSAKKGEKGRAHLGKGYHPHMHRRGSATASLVGLQRNYVCMVTHTNSENSYFAENENGTENRRGQ